MSELADVPAAIFVQSFWKCSMVRSLRLGGKIAAIALAFCWIGHGRVGAETTTVRFKASPLAQYRGPVDLIVAADETWAATINELASSVSLVDLKSGAVLHEIAVGGRPGGIALIGATDILVSCRESGMVHQIRITDSQTQLEVVASIQVGFEPLGLTTDGERAFVGLQATGEIAELSVEPLELVRRFPVGRWPRYLTLSPDGTRLAVGLSGDSEIAVLDSSTAEILYTEPLSGGINIGHMACTSDGTQVLFPWMIYRSNPITVGNIRRGWVLASRVAQVRLDGPAYREAISLDVPRRAVADPHGIAITPNEERLAVSSSGTHELLVYRLGDLPLVGAGGPGDLIDERLLRDRDRFFRIELGGRPMGMVASRDNETLFVANHLSDSIQLVSLSERAVRRSIPLGAAPDDRLARKLHLGMEIFYDAGRSLDQWYSCNSCHLDGGSNAKAMDTWNDGTELTPKTVLPLRGVTETGPWTWHGWQDDLRESLQNSFVSTMQGTRASSQDVEALQSYLGELRYAANPFVPPEGKLEPSAVRGRALFESSEVGCSDCHSGPNFSDGDMHDVGMIRDSDKYSGYNTPSLRGVYRKARFLHDGRAKTLEAVLERWHRPDEIGGGAELTEADVADLVSYLKTL